MFAPACIDYVTSFSLPPLLSHTHLFFTLSFFCSVFFPSVTLSVSLPALSFPLVVTLA